MAARTISTRLQRSPCSSVRSGVTARGRAGREAVSPSGARRKLRRSAKVVYSADGAPTLAARIQDLYGIKDALWIADRRVAVRIQVLAPNNRPVQITENLAGFWRDTYPKLKLELQRRYPRHVWR